MFSGLPLLLSVFGDINGGAVTDWIARRFGLRFGRCSVAFTGYALAGAAMFAAVLSAAMNTTGQVGSILSPVVAGWVVTRFADWQALLLIMGGLYCFSALLWTLVDPRKRL